MADSSLHPERTPPGPPSARPPPHHLSPRRLSRRKLIRTIALILATNALALALMVSLRRFTSIQVFQADMDAWANYLTTIGVIYAVLIGFILAELLTRFHRLSTHIHDELNAVQDIRDLLIYLDQNDLSKETVKRHIYEYVDSVVQREWSVMSDGSLAEDSDTSTELFNVMLAVEKLEMHDESDRVALAAIIQRISDVTTYRTERLEMSQRHLSPMLRFLLVFMSFVVGFGFILMRVASIYIQGFMVLASVTALHLLYVVIDDLDHPYAGLWNISREPFDRVAKRLQASVGHTQRAD